MGCERVDVIHAARSVVGKHDGQLSDSVERHAAQTQLDGFDIFPARADKGTLRSREDRVE